MSKRASPHVSLPDFRTEKGPVITVLVVTPHECDRVSLENMLRPSAYSVCAVSNHEEALAFVQNHCVSVAICEHELPDGDWRTLLDAFVELPNQPKLIVASRLADDLLWAEVLNLGGYDVLQTPFETDEVLRVVSLASTATRAAERDTSARRPAQGLSGRGSDLPSRLLS